MSGFKEFFESSIRLAKNPLGIIALFQVLIYGIAGYVTANIGSTYVDILKPMIWFLVLFPIAVLIVFAYLVIFHHRKLYAPSDFTDEANFMKSAGDFPRLTAEEFNKIRLSKDKTQNPIKEIPDEQTH